MSGAEQLIDLRVIGIDPGPTPGIVVLEYAGGQAVGRDVVQCTSGIAPYLLGSILDDAVVRTLVQVEKFVVSARSARSSSAGAGAVTRDLVGRLAGEVTDYGRRHPEVAVEYAQRPAVGVKAWATDDRLTAAGLVEVCKGMRHAKDAARHALYAATADGGIRDPLSPHATSPLPTKDGA